MAEYENLCKILAEKYPFDFARWLLNQELRQIEILKQIHFSVNSQRLKV